MAMRMATATMTMARLVTTTTCTMMTVLATTEEAVTMATPVTLAAAEMETPVPFHVVGRGDQGAQAAVADLHEAPEAEAHHHRLHQDGVVRVRRQAATRCSQLILWHLEASVRGIPTWSPGSLALANVRSNCRIIRITRLCANGYSSWCLGSPLLRTA